MFAERFAGYGPKALTTDNHNETLSVATLLAAVCGIMGTSIIRAAFKSSFNKLTSSLATPTARSIIHAIANATGDDSIVGSPVCTAADRTTNSMCTCWLENGCKSCKKAYVTFKVQSNVHFNDKEKKFFQITSTSENNLYRVTHSIYMWTLYGTKPLNLQSVEESTRTEMKNLLEISLYKLNVNQETLKRHTELLCEVLICLMCYAKCYQEPLSDKAIETACDLLSLPVVKSESKAQYHQPYSNLEQVPTPTTYDTHYNKEYCHTNQDQTLLYLDKDDHTKGLFFYCTHTQHAHTPNTLTHTNTHTYMHTHTHRNIPRASYRFSVYALLRDGECFFRN